MKIILGISLLLNIVFFLSNLFLPQYRGIGGDSQIIYDDDFHVGGYVKGLNFEEPGVKWLEYYMIFAIDGKYYYLNGVTYSNDGSDILTNLKSLEVKSNSDEKIELFDDVYTFEIYKSTGKVMGKDKQGDIFELAPFKKTFGYEWLVQ